MLTNAIAKEMTKDLLRPFGLRETAFNVRWAGMGGWRIEVIVSGYPAVHVETGPDWTEESIRWDLLMELRRALSRN
jgi:hypothetical protein